MPFYIEDEQIDIRKFMNSLGISDEKIERIIKKPSFKLHDSKVVKNKTVNSPLAKKPTYGVKTMFWFDHKENGYVTKKRLRYAESQTRKIKGGVVEYEYNPPRINVEGSVVEFLGQPDKALYMYLNPGDPSSPFYDKKATKFQYMDTIEMAKAEAAELSSIESAILHAAQASYEELLIVAKGLRIVTGNDFTETELRNRVRKFALNPETSKQYVKAVKDDMIRIEGRILNLVDSGIIVMKAKGSARQWEWGTGPKQGSTIGEAIFNPNEDAKSRLLIHIKSNLEDYIVDIRDAATYAASDKSAREYLASAPKEVLAQLTSAPVPLPEVPDEDFLGTPAPEPVVVPPHLANHNAPPKPLAERLATFKDCTDYVAEKGYAKHMALIKTFHTAVKEGEVNDDNVIPFLAKLFAK